MESSNNEDISTQSQPLSTESLSYLAEGSSFILSRWTALQMAIQNEWGGRESRQKSEQLASDIYSWFVQSKGQLYIDDLENMLDETMVGSFNAEIEDGSLEEVAEQLMIMHEDCLQGNYESIEKLRKSNTGAHAASHSKEVVDKNADESSDEEETSDMVVDVPKPKSVVMEEPKPQGLVVDEEGWSVVAPRRNKGKR